MSLKKIGLIIPQETYFFSPWASNYYFTEIMRGAIASASLFEWDILVHQRKPDADQEYVRFCEEGDIQGVMSLAPALSEQDLEQIKNMETPVIIINGRHPGISYVDTDNKQGAKKAAEHIIDMGHTDIAIINGDMSTTNACDRFEGYKMALSEAGIEINDKLVKPGKFSEDSGYTGMDEILSKEQIPTAVLCANDLIAIGAMKAIKKKKLKIPKDISVVGFDDLIISGYLTPPLTTVRQQLFHLGKEAVVTLMSIIRGEKKKYQEIEIETRLIKRDSVTEPRKG